MSDWDRLFRLALIYLLSGRSPYAIEGIFNPPWTFVVLVPAVWLPGLLPNLLPAAALIFAAYRKRKSYLIPIVGLSFPFVALVFYANLDWLVLLGTLTQGSTSLFLLTTKPQAGALAFVAQLKGKTWRQIMLMFAPLVALSLVFLALYPDWLQNTLVALNDDQRIRNFSLFPYTVPLALPLLWRCYQRQDVLYGVLATLCLAPYYYVHSYVPALFLIAERNWKLGLALSILSWVVVLLIRQGIIPLQL
ncbi:MAG: hypothetical protein U0694_06085 [Anaerolineae bacterium]